MTLIFFFIKSHENFQKKSFFFFYRLLILDNSFSGGINFSLVDLRCILIENWKISCLWNEDYVIADLDR
jgi:hypothetical protein